MPVLRLILPRAAVAGVAALLLGVPALAAQASASPAAASPGAVIQVAGAGAPAAVGDHAPGAYRVATLAAAQSLAADLAARENVTVELPTGTVRLPRPLVFTAADSGAERPHDHLGSRARRASGTQRCPPRRWVAAVRRVEQHLGRGRRAGRQHPPAVRERQGSAQRGHPGTEIGLHVHRDRPDNQQLLARLPGQPPGPEPDRGRERRLLHRPVRSRAVDQRRRDHHAAACLGQQQLRLRRDGEEPFEGGALYLENSLAFLAQAGQWYLDSATGKLYYEAPAGQNHEGGGRRTAASCSPW